MLLSLSFFPLIRVAADAACGLEGVRKEHANDELMMSAEVPFRGLLHAPIHFLAKVGISEAREVGESQHRLGLPSHARCAAALAL